MAVFYVALHIEVSGKDAGSTFDDIRLHYKLVDGEGRPVAFTIGEGPIKIGEDETIH